MVSISLKTFQTGQKSPTRYGYQGTVQSGQSFAAEQYQDYIYRDRSKNRRMRKWTVTHNQSNGVWTFLKMWTTQLPGEPQYVRVPKKIEMALSLLIARDFP